MPESTASQPTPYLLLFRNTGPENYRHLSPDQRQEVITRWNAWFEGLVAAGKAIEGQPLEMEAQDSRTVSGPGGQRVVDGPYPEAKEAIAGYVMLLVNDVNEATEIAKRHPALAYGLHIEVRKLTGDCHLGVNLATRASKLAASAS